MAYVGGLQQGPINSWWLGGGGQNWIGPFLCPTTGLALLVNTHFSIDTALCLCVCVPMCVYRTVLMSIPRMSCPCM